MHRLIRIGLIMALLTLVGGWVGGAHGVSAQGQTYTDAMDGSTAQLLSTESPDVAKYLYSYQNGQFIIQMLQPGLSGDLLAFAGVPDMTDSSVAVDFSIAGDLTGKYAFVGCRGADQNTGYIFEVHPDTGEAYLWRLDPSTSANLGTVTDTSVVNVGSGNNRIEIRCQGSTITGIANGTQLLTAQDTTFTTGGSFIGAGKTTATTDTLLTGFDNLAITDLSAGAAQPTQAPALPTQAPVQPTQAGGFPTAIPAQPTQAGSTTTSGSTETGTLTDPRVDPNGTLSDALVISLLGTPAAGPSQASDTLTSPDFKYLSSGVNLADFYATMLYTAPSAPVAGSWSYGFAFWDDGQGNSYDVFIQAKNGAAKWGFGQQTAAGYNILQSGDLAAGAVDFTPGAQNYIGLVVANGVAVLTGNDLELATTIDTGATGSGDVSAEVGFLADDGAATTTLPVSLSGFSVYDLSPAAVAAVFGAEATTPVTEPTQAGGFPTAIPAQPTQAPALPTQVPVQPTQAGVVPTTASAAGDPMLTQIFNQERTAAMASAPIFTSASGTLQQSTTGFGFAPAGVSVTDFYATATFVNPTDLSTRSDVGIGFRDLNTNTEFRFVVRTDGAWALAVATDAPLVQGTVTNFDATPGASNTLEIIARGATGILVLNGVVIQQVDLSGNLNAGDVYVASGMYASDTVDGRQVPYSNFQVYSLSA